MKTRLPHTKLSKYEFIMLRSLARTSWLSIDPVLWRCNRTWRECWFPTKDARVAAESLLRRGLVDCKHQVGFSPRRPGEPVKSYWINDRGTALLNKANGLDAFVGGNLMETNPHIEQSRQALWWRFLHCIRRRPVDVDTPHQSNKQSR